MWFGYEMLAEIETTYQIGLIAEQDTMCRRF